MENRDRETISLKTILVKYIRQWKLFLAVFIFSFIPAILYLNFYPRTYEFAASILLQDEKESGMSSLGLGEAAGLMKSFGIGGSMGSSIRVDDEMEILASNRLLRMVILDLGLNVSCSKPWSFYKMYREAPLKLTADAEVMAKLEDEIRFSVSVAPGDIKVKMNSYPSGLSGIYTFQSLPATIQAGTNEFILDFDNNGAQKSPFKLNISILPASWMAEEISKKIRIEDVSNASNVLTINCSEHVKQRGLDLLNTLVRLYSEDKESYIRTEEKKMMTIVDNRIAEIVTELADVEAQIEDYKAKNDMTLLEVDVTLYGEMLKELQSSIIDAKGYAYQIDLLDAYVTDPENKDKTIPSILSVSEGEKGVIGNYNKAITDRERVLKNANEKNLLYVNANVQVEKLREGVLAMIGNARKSTAQTLVDLKNKENQLLSKLKKVPQKEREYLNLSRNREVSQAIYLLMLQKKEDLTFTLGKQADYVRVIEPPYIKKRSIAPRKLYAAIAILALTLVIPVGYLFAKDLFLSIREELILHR